MILVKFMLVFFNFFWKRLKSTYHLIFSQESWWPALGAVRLEPAFGCCLLACTFKKNDWSYFDYKSLVKLHVFLTFSTMSWYCWVHVGAGKRSRSWLARLIDKPQFFLTQFPSWISWINSMMALSLALTREFCIFLKLLDLIPATCHNGPKIWIALSDFGFSDLC